MKLKRMLATLLATTVLSATMVACGGEATPENGGNESSEASSEDISEGGGTELSEYEGVEISLLNTKGEIQTALEDMAEAFEEETGIILEIQAAGAGESPYTKITSSYNAGTAPTMAMLDTADILALAEEFAMDLSNEDWIANAEGNLTTVNGTVYSFPFTIEGRGLIYNKATIEETLGTEFDPSSINSYDALSQLLADLRAAGMEYPVVISKEDWSLGAHHLSYVYETYDTTTEGAFTVMEMLSDGSLKVEDYDRFDEFVATFDLLAEYNINHEDPLGALYEQDPIFMVDGDAAIWFNGVWAWPNLLDSGASLEDEYGFLPYVLGNDTEDPVNNSIFAGASKQVMIDSVQATEEQQEAAKEFLDWVVFSETGQRMLVEDAAVIPSTNNNTNAVLDPLGQDIQAKMEAGETLSGSALTPSDHWGVLGAAMQKYLAGESTKEELAADINTYWLGQN